MFKISIIIPVYNVERYLDKCITSVINQSYRNIEVILVDDGSPDNSGAICDRYSKSDNRIIVIHKQNGGLSDARNAGIKKVTGDYILFLDSDDYWRTNTMLEELVSIADQHDVDVINFGHCSVFEKSTDEQNPWIPECPNNALFLGDCNTMTKYHQYRSSACMKMVKSDIVKAIPRFEEGRLSEDIVWSANVLSCSKYFASVPKVYYCHLVREGSITTTMNEKSCIDLAHAINECVNIAERVDKEKKVPLYRYAAYQLGTFLIVQACVNNCPSECFQEMKEKSWLLKYHASNKRVIYAYWLEKILGFKLLCKLLRLAKHR